MSKRLKFEIEMIETMNELDKTQWDIDIEHVIEMNNKKLHLQRTEYKLVKHKVNLDIEFVEDHFEM